MWKLAPYTEDDLQRQIGSRPRGYERESDELREDLAQYVAGINAYIAEARLNPLKVPGEYAAVNRPQGPEDWKGTDVVATAAVIGAIFGVGGGPGGRFRPGAGGGPPALRAQAGAGGCGETSGASMTRSRRGSCTSSGSVRAAAAQTERGGASRPRVHA